MVILIVMFYYAFFIISGGFIVNNDYKNFHDFLIRKIQKECIYVESFKTIEDINANNKSERVLGYYKYIKNATPIENFTNRLPKIEWCEQHIFGKRKTLFPLMTLAHELGHHYAITKDNDRSEQKADEYSIILFKEYFSIIKQIIYFPILLFYTQKKFTSFNFVTYFKCFINRYFTINN